MVMLLLLLSVVTTSAHAATLSGAVVGADGAPVARAVVAAYDLRLGYATTRTDADGNWRIAGLPAGSYRVRAVPADDDPRVQGFLPEVAGLCESPALAVAEEDVRDGLDLTLAEGGRITGRVLDAGGAPVVGATVATAGASERAELTMRRAVTDADGRFTLVGLDSDVGVAEPYLVAVQAAGFPEQYLGPSYRSSGAETVEVTRGEVSDLGEWTLLDGIRLSGRISGPDGAVDNGVVYAYSTSQVEDADIAEDGSWSVDGLPPGDVLYWAESEGLATSYFPGGDRPTPTRFPVPDAGTTRDDADLELPVEAALTLRFTGEGDLGEVSVLLYNSDGTVGRGAPVSADGTVRIGGLWSGDYVLAIYGDDGGFVSDYLRDADGVEASVVVDGESALDVALPREAGWSGGVVDEDGAPLYGAYVVALDLDTEVPRGTSSLADGSFSLGGLRGGAYTLRGSYAAACPEDPGYTTSWYAANDAPPARDEAAAQVLDLPGETVLDDTTIVLFHDDDHDTMGDTWEGVTGLDPTRDDSREDPDADGRTNAQEWIDGTDPVAADGEIAGGGCACGGKEGEADTGGEAAVVVLVGLGALGRRRRGGARRVRGAARIGT